jgi:hypothetical protein
MPQQNLAYYYVTGPVHIYVRIPNVGAGPYLAPSSLKGTIYFLGHTKDSPEPDFVPQKIPVISSLSGPLVPDDHVQVGGVYHVGMELARFNMQVLKKLKQFARQGRSMTAGTESFLDRGRLVLANGDSFELWLRNAFYGTPNSAAYPDLDIGYYFPACTVAELLPRDLSQKTKLAHIQVEPHSVRQGVTGGYISYSQDPIYFNNLPDPG